MSGWIRSRIAAQRNPRRRGAAHRAPILLAVLAAGSLGVAAAPLAAGASLPAAPTTWSTAASATSVSGSGALASELASGANRFLPPDEAFRFSVRLESSNTVLLQWAIAPGYYLYRDRIRLVSPDAALILGAPHFPPGEIKNDPYFGRQVIYRHHLSVRVAVAGSAHLAGGRGRAPLQVTYQGCADGGLCYPPITKQQFISLAGSGAAPGASPPAAVAGGSTGLTGSGPVRAPGLTGQSSAAARAGGFVSEQEQLAGAIRSGNLFGVLATFFGLGVLLAFTPCVLPMLPILSGLIVGHGSRPTAARAFALSLAYVLGMAVTYTVAGAAFAAAGHPIQALFEQPWVIGAFAALFVALALSMLGLYTLQLPSALQTALSRMSERRRSGHLGGVAVMGALSALIVTSCIAPPLVAALAVIGQSGDVLRGSAALFSMSLGMGAPLLVLGTSAARWLPRSGAWMEGVQRLFGVLMLAVAAWMLARIASGPIMLLLFSVPAAAASVVLWRFMRGRVLWPARLAAILIGLYAAALLVGAVHGGDDLLAPLAPPATVQALNFHPVESLAGLRLAVSEAAAEHRPALLDVYATWCTSCQELEHRTFADPRVRALLRSVVLIRADVTANSAQAQALLQHFRIYGPPTVALYDAHGREQRAYRVVGYMGPSRFAALLRRFLAHRRA